MASGLGPVVAYNPETDCGVCLEQRPLVKISEAEGEEHSFCRSCVDRVKQMAQPKCPVCRRAIPPAVVPDAPNPLLTPAQLIQRMEDAELRNAVIALNPARILRVLSNRRFSELGLNRAIEMIIQRNRSFGGCLDLLRPFLQVDIPEQWLGPILTIAFQQRDFDFMMQLPLNAGRFFNPASYTYFVDITSCCNRPDVIDRLFLGLNLNEDIHLFHRIFHAGIYNNRVDFLQRLYPNGLADLPYEFRAIGVRSAARLGHLPIVQFLLADGAVLSEEDLLDAIRIAEESNHPEIVQALPVPQRNLRRMAAAVLMNLGRIVGFVS